MQEYVPVNDPLVPQVTCVKAPDQAPTEEELDKEIFLLEREIMREIEETADLQGEVDTQITKKADTSRESEAILER